MLEMLVVANSAFAIIKKTIENGRELTSAGSAIANFVGAEDKLRADVQNYTNVKPIIQISEVVTHQ